MIKSLKDLNKNRITLFLSANFVFFSVAVQTNALFDETWLVSVQRLYELIPAGLSALIAGFLNNQISANQKAKIVYFKDRHPLPGCRAFSKYAVEDPRINLAELKKKIGYLPTDPEEQNTLWYSLYRKVENEISIVSSHKDFLLARDCAAITLILIILFGISGLLLFKSTLIYLSIMGLFLLEFFVVQRAARISGIGFVNNVLASYSVRKEI